MGKFAFFYNDDNGDCEYDAESMTEWLKPFFTTGVFNGKLQVTANNDMSVTVGTGYCNIGGKVKNFTETTPLDLEVASGTLNRIDNVILRRDDTKKDIYLMIEKGGNAQTPTAPDLTRDGGIYDLKLAEIYVAAGTIAITQANITDTRMNADVCGWVASTVSEIEFDQIAKQFEEWCKENQADFEAWFESVKNTLGEDAAGNLYNEIEANKANTATNTDNIAINTANIATNKKAITKTSEILKSSGIGESLTENNYLPDNLLLTELINKETVAFFTVKDDIDFPEPYGSGIIIPTDSLDHQYIIYQKDNRLYTGDVIDGKVTWSEQSQKSALDAFIKQIKRDYYGTDGWHGPAAFDLMPNGDKSAQLTTLGSCYLSTSEEVANMHGPSDAKSAMVFAFGMNTYRYGMIAIQREAARMWIRAHATGWEEMAKMKDLKGTVVWENPDPTAALTNEWIPINFSEYSEFEVIYAEEVRDLSGKRNGSKPHYIKRTGKIQFQDYELNMVLESTIKPTDNAGAYPTVRTYVISGGTDGGMLFNEALSLDFDGELGGSAMECIPLKVIAYV